MNFRLDGDFAGFESLAERAAHRHAALAPHLLRGVHRCRWASGHEFNFAPSGEWTVYVFSGYRTGCPLSNEKLRPHIAVRFTDSRLELDALVRLDGLSVVHPLASLLLGSRRLSRLAMGSRTGRFAIGLTNRIFVTPMDSSCCLSRRAPGGRSTSLKFGFEC
jgi:hypothetical protein